MINPVSWVDVDLDAIANNIKVIKKYIGNTRLLAVVKPMLMDMESCLAMCY